MWNIKQRYWIWINWLITAVLILAGAYYLWNHVDLKELSQFLYQANALFILLTLLVLLLTLYVKTWRWQILLTPQTVEDTTPPLKPLFWALMLGQYVNLLFPFLRLGEIARIFAINDQTNVNKSQALGTLIVEKFMDLALLGVTMGLALLVVIAPVIAIDSVNNLMFSIGLFAVIGLGLLYGVAMKPEPIIILTKKMAQLLPSFFSDKIIQIVESGLTGLNALTNRRQLVMLIFSSFLVAVLSVLTPYTLFWAFDMPLGIVEAAWLHIIVTLALVPPSSPGKIGVLDGAVIIVLRLYGVTNEVVLIGYALIFHLILVMPQIILGAIASARTGWYWQTKEPETT